MKPFRFLIPILFALTAFFAAAQSQSLPSLWDEPLFRTCETHDIEACFQAAKDALNDTVGLSQNRESAQKLKQLCMWQYVPACFYLGQFIARSDHLEVYEALLGTIALQTACDLDHTPSCAAKESLLKQESRVTLSGNRRLASDQPADVCIGKSAFICEASADKAIEKAAGSQSESGQKYKQAIALYDQACQRGAHQSCLKLFEIYSDFEVETRDFAKAMDLLNTMCAAGSALDCETLAFFHLTNQVIARNLKEAKTLLSLSCFGFVANACATLSDMALNGDYGTKIEPAKGYEFRSAACFLGHAVACLNIGFDLETGDGENNVANPKQAANFYGLACKLELGAGCGFLAELTQSGLGVPQSSEGAEYLFDKGCFLEDAESCFKLGLLLENNADATSRSKAIHLKEAIKAFEKGCALNSAEACSQAGYWFEQGTSVVWLANGKDLDRAISNYQKACSLNSATGCFNLGLMHETGRGRLKKSDKQARILFKKSCSLGLKAACLN